MRRSVVFVVVAVIGLMLASASPASSDPDKKSEVQYGIECFEVDFTQASFNEAGNTVHLRGGAGVADEYVWDGSTWVWKGTNNTVVNVNDNLKSGTSAAWGTFSISLDGIGDFDGHWADGVARGSDGDGKLVKVDLAPDLADFPPLPGFGFCGEVDLVPPVLSLPPSPYTFLVIDTGG